jgi:hypothetical protein
MDNSRSPIKPISGAIGVEHYAQSIGSVEWYVVDTNYFVAVFG